LFQDKYLKAVAVFMIILGVVTASFFNYHRIKGEQAYTAVEILVDYDELQTLATAHHLPLGEVAAKFREAGATGVVVRERTVQDLKESGELVLLKGNELALQQSNNSQFLAGIVPVREYAYLLFPLGDGFKPTRLGSEVLRHLQAKKTGVTSILAGNWQVITVPGLSLREQEKLGLGFPHQKLEDIKEAGLAIVPRMRSFGPTGEEHLAVLTASLRELPGLSLLTFNDEALSGSPVFLAEHFKELQVPVGTFEFYNQYGLNQLGIFLDKNVVRVHCISEEELRNFNEQTALERYSLAVSERNIRALYVRLFGLEQPEPALERGISFIGQVKQMVEGEGLTVGPASQLPSLPYSRFLVLAVGLGVIGGVLLLLRRVFSPVWTAILGGLALLGWAGLLYVQPLLARKAFALLAAIVFPLVAVISFVDEEKKTVRETVAAFLKMSGVSLIGAVLLTGLLADKSFLLKLAQFSGVKLAHLLPLMLVPLYYFWKEYKDNLVGAGHKLLMAPVLIWYAVAAGFILVVLVVYLLRTGNDAPALVTSLETTLRGALDQLLGVRPRTKEFLVGHPAMLLLLYYGFKWPRVPLLFLGVIGQISLVNTYAHLHTPLFVSLLRSFHGLWLGLGIGLVAILVMRFVNQWLARRLPNG